MATKYQCLFYSENATSTTEQRWRIDIDSNDYSGSIIDFKCTSEGFILDMDGGDDGFLAPIKTTSVSFNMILETASQEAIIDDMLNVASGNEDDFSVVIYNYYNGAFRKYWIGYLLGDLFTLDDTSINRVLKIQATDGINRLKYLYYDQTAYGGVKSALNIIKTCLSPLTLTTNYFQTNGKYIGHNPFYYNESMLGGSAWNSTWRNNVNHDPLSLTKINTQIFKDTAGKSWSYYKILEQILATFQLRIMMTQINVGDGEAMWYLQSPIVFHGNNNNDDYIQNTLIIFHNYNLSSDIGVGYSSTFNHKIQNPSHRMSGSKEMFIPPLLSYKSIYNHSIFNGLAMPPQSFTSTSYENDTSAGSAVYSLENVNYDLSGREDVMPYGFVGDANNVSQQRILITGNITTDIIDNYTAGGLGYLSGQEYWENNYFPYTDPSGTLYNTMVDSGFHFPRMGMMVRTNSEATTSGGFQVDNFWLGEWNFGTLFGSVAWNDGNGFDYPNTFAGYNATESGLKFDNDFNNYPSNTYTDSQNITFWGTQIGDGFYWYRTPNGEEDADDNDFSWFSPSYNEHEIINFIPSTTWNNNLWSSQYSSGFWQNNKTFSILSNKIPWGREDGSASYGWSKITQLRLFLALKRDRAEDSAGNLHYTCCKDWNSNYPVLTEDRGIQFMYSYSDVRVYVVGAWAGADSYDSTISLFNNTAGTCSDEDVQSPEIIIGDEPEFDPYADNNSSEGFGGVYVGQFTFITTADSVVPQTGALTQQWRTIHQTTTEDMKLHLHRAKQGIAHRYSLKQKLELNFIDRNTNFNLSRWGFSSIISFNSGDWYQNQAGAVIAFIPTGGTFVAGTGIWRVNLEDCVTYSKDGLTDNSYSTNG